MKFKKLEDLSVYEMKNLNGGEAGWYYLGKAVTFIAKAYYNSMKPGRIWYY